MRFRGTKNTKCIPDIDLREQNENFFVKYKEVENSMFYGLL